MTPQGPPVAFRDKALEAELDSRGDRRGLTAARDLRRYYALLARELRAVSLTEPEWNLLRDALNGSLLDETSVPLLRAGVEDAIRLGQLDQKWHVDGDALIDKLRGLSPSQTFAVVDAVERWWQAQG